MPEGIQQTMTLNLDLYAPSLEVKKAVRSSIKLYRSTAARVFSALALSEFAGSELQDKDGDIRLKPVSKHARAILTLTMRKYGKALAYSCRQWVLDEIAPTWKSFVWDSLRRDVSTAWRSHDPEFPKVTRGWLILQAGRGLAQFRRRGIGFPAMVGKAKIAGRAITMEWDREIGPVQFRVPNKMDSGSWAVWRRIESGEWPVGTVYLTERDGKLRLHATYRRPSKPQEVDASSVLEVKLPDESSPDIRLVDGEEVVVIQTAGAYAVLGRLRSQMSKLEDERGSAGSPVRQWGTRKIFKGAQNKVHRITNRRTLSCADWNHQWSRRIAGEAVRRKCGIVKIPSKGGNIRDETWPWNQLVEDCKYKVKMVGVKLEVVKIEEEEKEGSPSNP